MMNVNQFATHPTLFAIENHNLSGPSQRNCDKFHFLREEIFSVVFSSFFMDECESAPGGRLWICNKNFHGIDSDTKRFILLDPLTELKRET